MTALIELDPPPDAAPQQSYAPVFIAAVVTILCLLAAGGGWGMYARLDAAVSTHGVLLAESRRKTVEHLEGGILERLLVAPGYRVAEGQVVALLDATQPRELRAQLADERLATAFDIWRLEAELADRAPAPAAAPAADEPARGLQVEAQLRRHDARRLALSGGLEALARRIEELTARTGASVARVRAAERQLALWSEERALTERLVASGASARQRLLEFDRTIAILEGERDEHAGLVAAFGEEIARTRAEIGALVQERRSEIAERLADARRAVAGLESRERAAEDILERHRLRAPQAGLVVDIRTVTPGAVIGSGAPLMEIVPDGDALVVQTRIPPDAIDTVYAGRPATVRLTAFKRALAPVVDGRVSYVSADLLEDPRDGATYFDARVTLDPDSVASLEGVEMTAGMPVEVQIRIGERRAGDFMLEPILRHMRRALLEE